MIDKQPEALRLADALELDPMPLGWYTDAAAELRRLHEENLQWQEKCNTYMELHDAVVKDSDRLYALNAELVEALQALFDDYKRLADSGDAGNWSLEDLPVGQQALAALRKAQGDNNANG